jgi:hypothetical protein
LSDIFEEVDQSVRQDRVTELWKKYGLLVWLAAALLIGGVALFKFMEHNAGIAAQERSAALEVAIESLEAGKYAEAESALQVLVDADTKLSPLAAHYLAQTRFAGNGDAVAAANTLSSASQFDGDPYQKLALLKTAYFRADTLSLTELEAALGGLLADEGTVGAMARELVAAKAYADGDISRARTEFNRLKFDPSAPEGVIRRADLALAAMPVVAQDTGEMPTEPPAEPAAPTQETEETSP